MFYFLVLVQIINEIFTGNFSTCLCQFSGMPSSCLLNEDGIGSVNDFLNIHHIPEKKGHIQEIKLLLGFQVLMYFSPYFLRSKRLLSLEACSLK